MRPASAIRLVRRLSLFLALAATMSIVPPASAVMPVAPLEKQLAGYKNNKRVLLVFAPGEDDPRFQDQRKRWASEQSTFADYELVVLSALTAQKAAAPLVERFGIKPDAFAVLLIGKDGNEAYRSEKPVEAKELYRRIDTMPMRRAEVRERGR